MILNKLFFGELTTIFDLSAKGTRVTLVLDNISYGNTLMIQLQALYKREVRSVDFKSLLQVGKFLVNGTVSVLIVPPEQAELEEWDYMVMVTDKTIWEIKWRG